MKRTKNRGDFLFDFVCEYQKSSEVLRMVRLQVLVTLILIADISGGHFAANSLKWYLLAYVISSLFTLGWYFFFRRKQPTRILVDGDKIELVFSNGEIQVSDIEKCNLTEPDHGSIRLSVENRDFVIAPDLTNLDLLREVVLSSCTPQELQPGEVQEPNMRNEDR